MHKYLKTYLVLLILLIIASSTTNISANSGPPIRGIVVEPNICEITYSEEHDEEDTVFPNNFDILVKIDNFEVDSFGDMTNQYKEFYPFYESIDYLDNIGTGWTSFSAYYTQEDSWGFSPFCGMQFGGYSEVELMESIILVYFADNGDTLYLSEEIEIPDVLFYQDRDSIIYFNTETMEIDSRLTPNFDPYFILTLIVVFILIIYSIVIEVAVAIIFKLKTKKILLNILFINFFTQIMMYIYFYLIYNPHGNSYMEHLFFYEIIVLFVEFLYLHFRFRTVISWKRLMLYVLISNIVSYLFGVFRYM